MKKLTGKLGFKAHLLGVIVISLPVQAFAAITTLTVTNNLHIKADVQAIGVTAAPIMVQIYAAAGTATKACDSITSLLPGASYTTTTAKCATINHFVVTPLSSTVSGKTFPYISTPIDTTIAAAGSVGSYSVTDTGAGTAPTGGVLVNGIPGTCTAGTAAGSGDDSIPPLLGATTTGIVLCAGTATVAELPSVW